MRIELEDTTPGHKAIKVVATERDWEIVIMGNTDRDISTLRLQGPATASTLYRVLGKVLNAIGELA